MDYSFLSNLTLVDTGRLKVPKAKNPEGLTLRIFNDGSVYPSVDLVAKFNLEYTDKEAPQGNGIDVIDSQDWPIFAGHQRFLMFGITPKKEKKVDLFATCRYDETGKPKSTVLTQGSVSGVLLDLVRDFGWLTENQKYVDLKVVIEHPFNTADGLAFIPKVLEKGERKGERSYERREGVSFYPVEATDMTPATTTTATKPHEKVVETVDLQELTVTN